MNHPAFEAAKHFFTMIQERREVDEILTLLKPIKVAEGEESVAEYDADNVAIFTAVLFKMASKTFSHSFAALTK